MDRDEVAVDCLHNILLSNCLSKSCIDSLLMSIIEIDFFIQFPKVIVTVLILAGFVVTFHH